MPIATRITVARRGYLNIDVAIDQLSSSALFCAVRNFRRRRE